MVKTCLHLLFGDTYYCLQKALQALSKLSGGRKRGWIWLVDVMEEKGTGTAPGKARMPFRKTAVRTCLSLRNKR
jgi:hypothetical protein